MSSSISSPILTLHEKLGEGSYGRIYRCTDSTSAEFAVKCIASTKDGVPCLMETSIMSVLQHPYLNKAIKIYPVSEILYIFQELAIMDLRKWRHKYEPSSERVRYWVHCLIQSVSCLHQCDIIHGDIKACNVLVYKDEQIKLTDFTLSSLKNWPKYRSVCTSTHRPIEVWLKRDWDMYIDIWSLGCTIFELIYGYSLFSTQKIGNITSIDASIDALLDWAKRGPLGPQELPVDPRGTNFIPFLLPDNFDPKEPLNRLILSMLNLDPLKRPSAIELLRDPYFKDLSISPYTIISTPSASLSIKKYSLVTEYLKKLTTNSYVFSLAYELYTRLIGLEEIELSLKITTCFWIAYKLITKETPADLNLNHRIHLIMRAERNICQYLSFRLHTSSEQKNIKIICSDSSSKQTGISYGSVGGNVVHRDIGRRVVQRDIGENSVEKDVGGSSVGGSSVVGSSVGSSVVGSSVESSVVGSSVVGSSVVGSSVVGSSICCGSSVVGSSVVGSSICGGNVNRSNEKGLEIVSSLPASRNNSDSEIGNLTGGTI